MFAVVTIHSGEPHLVRIDTRHNAARLARRLRRLGRNVLCVRWAYMSMGTAVTKMGQITPMVKVS